VTKRGTQVTPAALVKEGFAFHQPVGCRFLCFCGERTPINELV
jgi:hypothetical protein